LQAIEKLAGELGPSRLLLIEYHVKDRWSFAQTEALYHYYNAPGTPTVLFDGENKESGGGGTVFLYELYKQDAAKALTSPPPVRISGAKLADTVSGPVSVRITNTSSQTISSARLFGVAYQNMAADRHRFLVSDISTALVDVLSPGETLEFELPFQTQATALNIALFLKSASGIILQATLLPGSDFIWLP
jgi:hypothetical protein